MGENLILRSEREYAMGDRATGLQLPHESGSHTGLIGFQSHPVIWGVGERILLPAARCSCSSRTFCANQSPPGREWNGSAWRRGFPSAPTPPRGPAQSHSEASAQGVRGHRPCRAPRLVVAFSILDPILVFQSIYHLDI